MYNYDTYATCAMGDAQMSDAVALNVPTYPAFDASCGMSIGNQIPDCSVTSPFAFAKLANAAQDPKQSSEEVDLGSYCACAWQGMEPMSIPLTGMGYLPEPGVDYAQAMACYGMPSMSLPTGVLHPSMDPHAYNSYENYENLANEKSTKSYSESSLKDLKEASKLAKALPLTQKLTILKKALEEIEDDDRVLITGKPKNKSKKIQKSNRHSNFRGVSRNGKKWQVMIIGTIRKKYFGAIPNERDAAIFYDKLSILTNGLSAKTNFNYKRSELLKMIPELERIEPVVSN